ncbi:uncharacterized protein DS421_17g581090 [Arachis hypogaea]|nr:uncharacterized protein DS421_17g581090 [Arachis hypogaea]
MRELQQKERSARRGGRRPHLTTFIPPTRRHCTASPPCLRCHRTPSSTKGARHRGEEVARRVIVTVAGAVNRRYEPRESQWRREPLLCHR